MYRVARKSADLLRMSLVMATAMLAICLLALVETTNTAEATRLPENGKIAFSSSDGHIYTVKPDGSNLRQLTNGPYQVWRPSWSPDGTEIVFADLGEAGIAVMSADGSNRRNLYENGGEAYGNYPTWSPDGTKLAFAKSTPTSNYPYDDIVMMDLDGFNQTNLTNTSKLAEAYPDFSPNDSQICFFRQSYTPKQPPTGIYVMDADGSDPTLLYENPSLGKCAWSPNGTKIAFTVYQEALAASDKDVYVINADGSDRTALTSNSGAEDIDPAWSPDGTKIAFASARDGDYDIYTMDADGSNVAQVTTNSGVDDQAPDWQPLPPKGRSETVHPPDTGGPSLLLVASALLCSVGILLYAVVRRRM